MNYSINIWNDSQLSRCWQGESPYCSSESNSGLWAEDSWLDVESFPSIVWSVSELFTQRNLLEPIYWIQHELSTYFYFLCLLLFLNNLTKYEIQFFLCIEVIKQLKTSRRSKLNLLITLWREVKYFHK